MNQWKEVRIHWLDYYLIKPKLYEYLKFENFQEANELLDHLFDYLASLIKEMRGTWDGIIGKRKIQYQLNLFRFRIILISNIEGFWAEIFL